MRTELGEYASAWDELVARMPLPSPFLRSWWVDHAAIGEPVIALCLDGGRLIGGIALQRTTRYGVDWLEMLGDGLLGPDHLDLVADRDRALDVRTAVRGWLGRRGSRVLDLRGLVPSGDLVACCPGLGPRHEQAIAPYAELPATNEEYLKGRPGKLRSTVKRSAKRFDAAGITTRVRTATEVDDALDAFAALHDGRWGEASGFMGAWDQFAGAARAGAASGEVIFTELVDADGDVVASEVDLLLAGRLSFYQAGRRTDHDLRGSGSVLKARIIAAAIADGCTEFDLLRGDEPYKTEWATSSRRIVRIRTGVGVRGIAVAAVAELNALGEPWRVRRAIARGERARERAEAEAAGPTTDS